jgi:hypothetical protein
MLVYLKPLQRYCIFLICANIFTTNHVLGGILIRVWQKKERLRYIKQAGSDVMNRFPLVVV